jgi:hypothetical protein
MLLTLNGSIVAAIPSSRNAFAKVDAAGESNASDPGCNWIETSATETTPAIGRWPPRKMYMFPPSLQSICVQPASVRVGSRTQAKSCCSELPKLNPVSNIDPAKGLSFSEIEICCSEVKYLGSLNLANSNRASAAFWSASDVRAVASAIFMSERCCNSRDAPEAFRPKWISAYTPNAIRQSAITAPQLSIHFLSMSNETVSAIITSSTNPTTIAQAPHSARASLVDISLLNWSSVLLISPYRRHKRGPHPASAVVIGILIGSLFVLAHWFLK